MFHHSTKTAAFDGLIQVGIQSILPSFNIDWIIEAKKRELALKVPLEEMKGQIEDKNCPMSRMFGEMESLGRMIASVACRLHDETTVLDQPQAITSFFTNSSFPVRGDTMVIRGNSMPMPNDTHKGEFDVRVVTVFSERKIATGNVTFRIPTSVEKASVPQRPPTPTPSPSPLEPPVLKLETSSPSPLESPVLKLDPSSPSPLESPVLKLETSSPSSSPTKTSDEAMEAPKPSSTDVEGRQQISNETFSLVNVEAPCPESFLHMKLSKIGVVGTNVKVFPMPTTDEGHVVIIFDVKSDEEKKKIQTIVASQDWSKLFHIDSLLTGRPFISVKLSRESLMRAIVIASTNDTNATVETLRLTLLNDDLMRKRTSGRNAEKALANIKPKLSEDGQQLLGNIQRLFRKRRGSCRY